LANTAVFLSLGLYTFSGNRGRYQNSTANNSTSKFTEYCFSGEKGLKYGKNRKNSFKVKNELKSNFKELFWK